MANSFLQLYFTEYNDIDIGDKDYTRSMNDYKKKVEEWKKEPEKFNDWVLESNKKPTVLALPAKGGKVSFLYCLSMDDLGEQLLGVRCFNPREWSSVNPEELWVDLVPDSLAKKSKGWMMPTIKQILSIENEEEVLEISGEGKKTMEEFGKLCPASLTWPSIFLPDIVEEKNLVPANVLLFSAVKQLKQWRTEFKAERGDYGIKKWEECVRTYGSQLLYLWVIANGGASSITVRQKFNSNTARKFQRKVNNKWKLILSTESDSDDETTDQPKEQSVDPPNVEDPFVEYQKKKETEGLKVTFEDVEEATDDAIRGGFALGEAAKETKKSRSPSSSSPSTRSGTNRSTTAAEGGRRRSKRKASPCDEGEEEKEDTGDGSDSDYGNLEPDEGGAGRRANGGDDPSSSDSSHSEIYSSGEDDNAEVAKYRSEKRRRLEAIRSKGKTTQVLAEMAVESHFLQQKKMASDKQKKSATSQWDEDHRRLVGMLTLPDDGQFPRREPKPTKFANEFFRERTINYATNRMNQAIKPHWPGTMLRSGIATLVSQGFVAPEHHREQMGFTVFHFAPIGHKEDMTQKEREQMIRTGFGSGELSEDLVTEYARKKLFIPFTTSEAVDMLEVCISVLSLLFGNASIATTTYTVGKSVLSRNRMRIHRAIESDAFYLVKFLFFIDGVFQNLLQALLECMDYRDPVRRAEHIEVHKLPRYEIEDVMSNFLRNGVPVPLPSPVGIISGVGNKFNSGRFITPGSCPDESGDGPVKPSPVNPKGKDGDTPRVGWHKKNPCPCNEWQFPSKTATKVFFPADGGFNQKIPKFAHHITGSHCSLCLKYQTTGECIRGPKCKMSHVPPDKMPRDKYDKVEKVILEQKKIAKEKGLLE